MAKSVGIVAEYNPFHTGHRYQLDTLRKMGYDCIAVAMSGSRVQRGMPAVINKHQRCEMALENGVDIVVEIPCVFSLRSAEGYARRGMQTLKAMGVDAVSFGSECSDAKLLSEIAEYLLTDEYENRLKTYIADNLPFANAREKAIFDRFDINRDVVSASNDILAIEYLKACKELNWQPEFIPIKRTGAAYRRTNAKDGYASASGIRKMISEYRTDVALQYIPAESRKMMETHLDRGSYFLPDNAFEKALLMHLSNKTAEDFSVIPDCNEELCNSFEKAISAAYSLDNLYDMLPTKRYTRSRLNRIIMNMLTGVDKTFPRDIQYLRVLGFTGNGEEFFRAMAKNSPLPVSHSAKILGEKNELCQKIAAAESRACDIQSLMCKISQPPRADFTAKLIKNNSKRKTILY
ncbi:MAG: nucleotidyltransferase family protein [Oscillospiraceae bacterium]|nr:nucleotidyltransferase family protein [Oscillospiraceae bacterium]